MAYIRDKSEERTGYQAAAEPYGKIDLQCDFVMAYRLDDTVTKRIKMFADSGYVVHMMAGIAWGRYVDYLRGEFDGREHWDESQKDRFGNEMSHGEFTPYMVPTVSFADYLTEKFKRIVDAGAVAIHVEEPEFWDRAGYSEAFKREYLLYYKQEWKPPYSDLDTRCKAARLKAYLYRRTIDRVSCALKEYALTKYGRELRFYVPTHSLLNYTQWKIVSPEGALADLPGVDGFIAQVWTGTSREKNFFEGVFKERTFETAYLEYGVMQELVNGTGKKMWFLHDPIEDNPAYDWADYQYNYLKTVTASLLHPKVNSYEICPWPNRVFDGKYPSNSPSPEPISPEYTTLLNSVFQTLGDMECAEAEYQPRVGVLISDTALFQRDYSDDVLAPEPEKTGTVLVTDEEKIKLFTDKLFKGAGDRELFLEFNRTNSFPSFYGLSLPLLKYGMPVRPVLLDNVNRYPGYLDDYDVLVLSYEFMKPDYPNLNNALAAWVRQGGTLIYVGDGNDPYHKINSWWSKSYASPAEHLFEMLGIAPQDEKSSFKVGDGSVSVWQTAPATLCYSHENAEEYRQFFISAIAPKGYSWKYKNSISVHRGTYITAAVFDESFSDEPLVIDGLFADMFTTDYQIIERKVIRPDENALLFDFSAIENDELRIIGTSVRVNSLSEANGKICIKAHGAAEVNANIRLRTPFAVSRAQARQNGEDVEITAKYDEKSRTVLLSFLSSAQDLEIEIQ